ncbi:MAG: cell division protein FtsQ/DivIB [Tumebacillaceae bacterium]
MQETPPTIAETYTNKTSSQERKRRPNWKALLFVVIFFGLVLLAGFLQSPLSSVSNIEVKGIHQIRYEDVVQVSQVQKGMSFWRVNKSDVADRILKSFPLVESADVQVSLSGNVVIAVVEKAVAGNLLVKDKLYRLLQDGTVLENTQQQVADNVPMISLDVQPSIQAGKQVDNDDLLALAKQIPQVSRPVLDQISEIHITAKGPWKIFMRDKFEVRITPREFAAKMKSYMRVRGSLPKDTKPEIINLLETDYAEPFPSQQASGKQ